MSTQSHKYKILVTAPWFTDHYLTVLEKDFDVTTNTMKRWFTENELKNIISEYDGIIAGLDPFNRDVLSRAKKLKIIARRGIGVDNIDLQYCKEHGIIVTNTPIPEEHVAVAEFTLGLILDAIRNITRSVISLKSGSWERKAFLGRTLRGIVIGIIGLGNTGRSLADMLKLLGATVVYYDPFVFDKDFQRVDLKTLFEISDVISINAPLNENTRRLIGKDLISLMKPRSYIVDVSRGQILNIDDVLQALDEGKLEGLALDVYDIEPPMNPRLLSHEKVICTPHIAAFSVEAFDKIDNICTKNIIKTLLYNEEPTFRVI